MERHIVWNVLTHKQHKNIKHEPKDLFLKQPMKVTEDVPTWCNSVNFIFVACLFLFNGGLFLLTIIKGSHWTGMCLSLCWCFSEWEAKEASSLFWCSPSGSVVPYITRSCPRRHLGPTRPNRADTMGWRCSFCNFKGYLGFFISDANLQCLTHFFLHHGARGA